MNLLSFRNPLYSKVDQSPFLLEAHSIIDHFSTEELAHIYVDTGILRTFLLFIKEQHWLQKKRDPTVELVFENFVTPFLNVELSSMAFLHDFFLVANSPQLKGFEDKAQQIENTIVKIIKGRTYIEQKVFFKQVLASISDIFESENQMQINNSQKEFHKGLSLYRTYDSLDEIFNLDYVADHGMKIDLNCNERLYEGAGVGVQSGYSTLLTALRYLNPPLGSRIVDLGSGYGRLGLVVGLLRPDIDFKGYEYVLHRVQIAMTTAKNLELQKHIHFYTQDLSQKTFQIPDAEIYYIYDPFSKDTYRHVLSQLVSISERQRIVIVTKGNASQWLREIRHHNNWPEPHEFDNGNLCLFYSN